jgi:hypothetical protein
MAQFKLPMATALGARVIGDQGVSSPSRRRQQSGKQEGGGETEVRRHDKKPDVNGNNSCSLFYMQDCAVFCTDVFFQSTSAAP